VAQATQYQTAHGPGGAPPGKAVPPAPPPRLSGRNSYSIFVGFMKVLLPALAVALILLVVVWPQLSQDDSRFRIRVSDISLEQADSLNARFEGVDDRNQPFTLTADEASQTAGDDNLVHLELPKGDITLEDGTWLAMTAREGRYRRDTQVLELSGEVTLFHDQGFELRTETARVDLDAGIAQGSEPVEGQGPFGNIVSEGFRVLERGERILFTGKSRAILHPGSTRAEP
jgi:lipopolysaccharide export system protein LptC